MKTNAWHRKSPLWTITEWFFVLIFFALGVLNLLLVHAVPVIVYLFLVLVYLPGTNVFLHKHGGFILSPIIKTIFGLIVLWATLAVGDLAELYGF